MPDESEEVKTAEKQEPTDQAGGESTPGKKSTQAEVMKRLTVIEELLLRGVGRQAILQYAGREWGISESMTDKYTAEIRKAWVRSERARASDRVAEATKRRNKLYELTIEAKDYRTALAVDDSLRKLQGILVERVRITDGEQEKAKEREALSHLSTEELEQVGTLQEKAENGNGEPKKVGDDNSGNTNSDGV